KTLSELGAAGKPTIMVFNKIDAFTYTPKDPDDLTPATRENISLEELKHTWMSRLGTDAVFISAKKQIGIDQLKAMLYEKAREIHVSRFPYNDLLFQSYEDLDTNPGE
ncbi:MAG: GTPase HflX, partial [Paramuribaculum sp.]|nr:GTPase HflX [Paramuribaculum sp.]